MLDFTTRAILSKPDGRARISHHLDLILETIVEIEAVRASLSLSVQNELYRLIHNVTSLIEIVAKVVSGDVALLKTKRLGRLIVGVAALDRMAAIAQVEYVLSLIHI